MICDMDAPLWWEHTIPCKDGRPIMAFFNHHLRDWQLVRDPHSSRRIYWEDSVIKVRRFTPPAFDKEIGCQTDDGLFLPDPPAESDVLSLLGASVAQLSPERQSMVYSRLVRFIELGWYDLATR